MQPARVFRSSPCGARQFATGNPSFIRQDDPEHARLRRMLTADFMVKKVEAMRPEVQRIADDLLDRMTEGRHAADLVAEFALPLPSLVICLLLGVPYGDHEFFQKHSSVLLSLRSTVEEVHLAQKELQDYLRGLAESKRREPDDGIVSRLVARGELDDAAIASMGKLLLVAGHETTANMTALSTLTLLRNPDQLARLRAEPSLIKGAVEELLRYLTIVHNGLPRIADEDVTIGGHTIRADEGVLCVLNIANRDEEIFPGGAALDVGRDARRHVAFGFGVHQCLGQPLARVELQIALETLLQPAARPAARHPLRGRPVPSRHGHLRGARPAGRMVSPRARHRRPGSSRHPVPARPPTAFGSRAAHHGENHARTH